MREPTPAEIDETHERIDERHAQARRPSPQTNGGNRQQNGDPIELRYRLTPLATIPPKPVRWLLEGRIPLGEVTLTPGRAGLGKSLYHCWLIGHLTNGTLPGHYVGSAQSCIVAATEDSYSHTIVPRLIAAGADLERVFRVDVSTAEGETLALTLPRDCDGLREMISAYEIALISLDPLLSRVDREIDTHSNRQVRDALEPLAQMAEETGCSILGNAHFRKAPGADPLTLVTASSAFGEVVRAAIGFARDPKAADGSVVISQIKNNLGKLDLPSQQFVVDEVFVDTDEGPAGVGMLRFTGESKRSIADILGERPDSEDTTPAEEFLADALDPAEWRSAKRVMDEARDLKITTKQLRTAREKMKIEVRADRGEDGRRIVGWLWKLPDGLDAPALENGKAETSRDFVERERESADPGPRSHSTNPRGAMKAPRVEDPPIGVATAPDDALRAIDPGRPPDAIYCKKCGDREVGAPGAVCTDCRYG